MSGDVLHSFHHPYQRFSNASTALLRSVHCSDDGDSLNEDYRSAANDANGSFYNITAQHFQKSFLVLNSPTFPMRGIIIHLVYQAPDISGAQLWSTAFQ